MTVTYFNTKVSIWHILKRIVLQIECTDTKNNQNIQMIFVNVLINFKILVQKTEKLKNIFETITRKIKNKIMNTLVRLDFWYSQERILH